MPKSMASSDPLSSPSPSPPPPTRSRLSNKSAAQQLDTSSELSELTDEDIDADKATPPSDEDDDDGLDDPKGDTLATRPTPKASRRTVHDRWTYKRKRRKDVEQDRDMRFLWTDASFVDLSTPLMCHSHHQEMLNVSPHSDADPMLGNPFLYADTTRRSQSSRILFISELSPHLPQ